MSSIRVRRSLALGLALALGVAGIATADTVSADGDALTAGAQASVNLGDVAPGAQVPLDVAFLLACAGTSHATPGTGITVDTVAQTWPLDGSATVTPGTIDVPATWPAAGADCPAGLTAGSTTPAHLVLTAPSTVGAGYQFSFLFAADPADGITNWIGFSATLNVVAPAPVDTTPPVLAGMPTDMTVFTAGTSATVTWPAPTATDDTDPAPTVACDPASGSTFALGTTTVTCTATDAAGNTAQGTFDVTVRQLAGTWGKPLDGTTVPALVGQLGRTIPLKLGIMSGTAVQGPGQVSAPVLVVGQLAGCQAGAPVTGSGRAGSFAWVDGTWQFNLPTSGLSAGCWRLTALVDGAPLTSAVVLLTADATAQALGVVGPGRSGR